MLTKGSRREVASVRHCVGASQLCRYTLGTGSWYTADKGWKWLIREFCAYNRISSKSDASQPFSEVLLHALQSLW